MPGPAVAYIVTQSIDQGRRAGLVSALGVASGGLVHVAAATVGLSALIASSATAFTVVKLVGAAYLIVVGIRRILDDAEDAEVVERAERAAPQLYRQGAIVNASNPEDGAGLLAFLPQFVDTNRGSVRPQVAFLGVIFAAVALTPTSPMRSRRSIAGRTAAPARVRVVRRWVSGSIFSRPWRHRSDRPAQHVTRIPLLYDARIVVAEPGEDDLVLGGRARHANHRAHRTGHPRRILISRLRANCLRSLFGPADGDDRDRAAVAPDPGGELSGLRGT